MNKKIISIIGIGTALFLGFAASPAEKTNNKEYETVEQELNVSNTSTQNIENKDTESNNQNNEEIMDYQSVDNKNENSFSNESNNNKKTDEILTSQNEEETTDNVITGSISPFTESESNNHDIEKNYL